MILSSTLIQQKAFSLIELLVVVGIIVIVSASILANNSQFGGKVLLQNFAYDLALSVRQAQVYGISVKKFTTNTGVSTFTSGYGMHFDVSNKLAGQSYILFADALTINGLYDQNELVDNNLISRGFYITQLCTTPISTNVETCIDSNSVSSPSNPLTLDILFKRPEPDALISFRGVSCVLTPLNCATNARIVVISPRGDLMSIKVQANGQITVQ